MLKLYQTSYIFFIFSLFYLSLVPTVKCDCVDVMYPKIRKFKSISELQNNVVPFNPNQFSSQGNYVGMNSDVTLDVLKKNTFIIFDAEHVRGIILDNHQIRKIEEGAFSGLLCLGVISLRKNKLNVISSHMFRPAPKLYKVDLGENLITDIPERVFNYSRGLTKLNLTKNSITVLHAASFYDLAHLTDLDLSYNHLKTIEPLAFQYLNNLANLQLGSNQIEYIQMYEWNGLINLQILNLSNNLLTNFNVSGPFSFRNTLLELHLDQNYLLKLNVTMLERNLVNLTVFNLNANEWLCNDLLQVTAVLDNLNIRYEGFIQNKPNVKGVSCYKLDEIDMIDNFNINELALISINSVKILDHIKGTWWLNVGRFVVFLIFIIADFTIIISWSCGIRFTFIANWMRRLLRRLNLHRDNNQVPDPEENENGDQQLDNIEAQDLQADENRYFEGIELRFIDEVVEEEFAEGHEGVRSRIEARSRSRDERL